jgi:hypothetical protein
MRYCGVLSGSVAQAALLRDTQLGRSNIEYNRRRILSPSTGILDPYIGTDVWPLLVVFDRTFIINL